KKHVSSPIRQWANAGLPNPSIVPRSPLAPPAPRPCPFGHGGPEALIAEALWFAGKTCFVHQTDRRKLHFLPPLSSSSSPSPFLGIGLPSLTTISFRRYAAQVFSFFPGWRTPKVCVRPPPASPAALFSYFQSSFFK